MLVERKALAVLWVEGNTDVSLGLVAKVVTILETVCVLWVVGEEGMIFVLVGEGLDSASVELRSGLKVEDPTGFMDMDGVVAGVTIRASVLTEEGGTVVDVCTMVEPGRDAVNADVAVLPVESVTEEERIAVVWTVVGVSVVTTCVLAAWVVSAVEGKGRGVVVEVGAAVSVGVVISVVGLVEVLEGGYGKEVW